MHREPYFETQKIILLSIFALKIILYTVLQSSTMPVLSLHNTYAMPSGSASYTLGLSGAPGMISSYTTYPTASTGLSSVLGGGLSGVTGLSGGVSNYMSSGYGTHSMGLSNPLSNVTGTGLSGLNSLGLGYNTNSSFPTYTNPLLSSGAMKLKTLDDLDLNRYNRIPTPCSPILPSSWGLDSSYTSGIDGVNPGFMHTQNRPMSRLGLDLDGE